MHEAGPVPRMNLQPGVGNICYVLDGGERVMRAVRNLETKQNEPNRQVRKAYPGATLRHLGSVRDVTLTKTHGPFEDSSGNHKLG
jgi:hypothetical protein